MTNSAPSGDYAAPTTPIYATDPSISPKSRTVAVILGFFLGGLGVDRFYLGNIGMGVAKLLVGWLTLGIWPLVDWIIVLTGNAHDGQKLRVTNWN
jgi:TM2 domain-containing membrane protein YozV